MQAGGFVSLEAGASKMMCPNCKGKELTKAHHDKCVMEESLLEFHQHCSDCDEVFVVYKNKNGHIAIKSRDQHCKLIAVPDCGA